VADRITQTTLENSEERGLVLSPDAQDTKLGQEASDLQRIRQIRILWDQRARLAKALLVSLVVSYLLVWLIPDSYEANVQLMPPDSSSISGSSPMLGLLLGKGESSSGSGVTSGLAGTVSDLLGGQKPGPLFIGILSSRTLSDRIIDRFDLRKVYYRKTYAGTRKKLASRVSFQEDKKSGIIRVTVTDRDRTRATAMAQAYVEELNALLAHVNTSAASREREFLEKRIAVIHTELDEDTKKLSEFSSQNVTFDPQDQDKAMLESAAALEGQLIAAKSELGGLQQIYTDDNVRVRSLQARITELERELNKLGGKSYGGSAALDPNSLYPSIRQLPVLGRQYLELYRQAKIDETVYELLTESYEMARVQEAKETPSVKVLDAARTPERKSWPPRELLALGGAILGLLFVSLWILGVERWAEIDDDEPYKMFLKEVSSDVKRDWARLRAKAARLISRGESQGHFE